MNHPDVFLELIFHESGIEGDNVALCAGFERGQWRAEQLADHVMEWLPEFALSHSELAEIGHHNAVKLLRKAAQTVYKTEKYGKRGEFGEILLHIVIRQLYQTLPAVSKIYYKSAVNETVKGFDAVHVVKKDDHLELWIGETKFYSNVKSAIYDVTKEIIEHLETDYLRAEFILIQNKIDPLWPEAGALKSLLDANVSLDTVFKRACIPILLTYDSEAVARNKDSPDDYLACVKMEISEAYENLRHKLTDLYFKRFNCKLPIVVHAMLIPLNVKSELIAVMDSKLKALQS